MRPQQAAPEAAEAPQPGRGGRGRRTVDVNLRAGQHEVDGVRGVRQHLLVQHARHDLVDERAAVRRAVLRGRPVGALPAQGA